MLLEEKFLGVQLIMSTCLLLIKLKRGFQKHMKHSACLTGQRVGLDCLYGPFQLYDFYVLFVLTNNSSLKTNFYFTTSICYDLLQFYFLTPFLFLFFLIHGLWCSRLKSKITIFSVHIHVHFCPACFQVTIIPFILFLKII